MGIPYLQILKPRFLRTVRRNGCSFPRTDAAWRAPNVTPADPRGDPYILIPLPATAPADPRGDPYILIEVAAAAPADPRGDPYILINQGHPGSWNVRGSMHNRRTPTLTLAPPVAQPALQPASFDQLPLISAAPPVAGRLFSIRKG